MVFLSRLLILQFSISKSPLLISFYFAWVLSAYTLGTGIILYQSDTKISHVLLCMQPGYESLGYRLSCDLMLGNGNKTILGMFSSRQSLGHCYSTSKGDN